MKTTLRHLVSAGLISIASPFMITNVFAADAAAGKAIYMAKCKGCHGADGTPSAGMAKTMGIKPISDAATQTKSDDALKAAVTKGAGKMKPVAGVAGADLDNVIAALRAMK